MATATASDTAKRGRAKKGEGPYSIAFVDMENKEHPRVPANVHSIKIALKDGKSQTFALEFQPGIIKQLAAEGLKRRLDASVRNGIGGEKSALVIAGEVHKAIEDGKLGAPKREGGKGGPGRTFDYDMYVSSIERTAQIMKQSNPKAKLPSKQDLANLRTKLEAMSTQERNEKVKQWKQNTAFNVAFAQVKAEALSKNSKVTAEQSITDLF